MEPLIQQIGDIGEQVVLFLWLPLLIWTILAGLIWMVLLTVSSIHPQHQYHSRLALLYSLPIGFLTLAVIQLSGSLFLPSPSDSLTFISVAAPFEVTVSATDTSVLTTTAIFYAGSFLFLTTGLILFTARNITQWLLLNRLKSECEFSSIHSTTGLDKNNLDLIKQTNKDVQIAFLNKEMVPVTFGIKKPVILIPNSIKANREKLNLVLRHELIHIAQNDFLTNVLISFTQILFWFHPLVHFLKRELIDYREIRCDTLVLSGTSVSKKRYASLLLELLPMPNINKELSVNMAQESSNLKKRIHMITQQNPNRPIPKRSSLALFAVIILSTAIAMSCTDMESNKIFDEEELDLMTNVDQTGERGYHEILIFLSNESQTEKHQEALSQLRQLEPEHIHTIQTLRGNEATEQYGERASNGVVVVRTELNPTSYNIVLSTLGMERQDISTPPPAPTHPDHSEEDFFVVVEEMPELIDGLAQLQQEIRYPPEARRAGIEGRVYVQFIVNEQGNVERPRVIRGIGGGADEEALRVVRQAKFKPGLQRGKPVRVQYSLPIFFRLANDENNTSSLNDSTSGDDGLTVIGYQSNESVIEEPEVNYNTMEVEIDRSGNRIEGLVTDSESGETLAGANVIIHGTTNGTVTDSNGQFTISNADPDHSLMISYIGYRPVQLNL